MYIYIHISLCPLRFIRLFFCTKRTRYILSSLQNYIPPSLNIAALNLPPPRLTKHTPTHTTHLRKLLRGGRRLRAHRTAAAATTALTLPSTALLLLLLRNASASPPWRPLGAALHDELRRAPRHQSGTAWERNAGNGLGVRVTTVTGGHGRGI